MRQRFGNLRAPTLFSLTDGTNKGKIKTESSYPHSLGQGLECFPVTDTRATTDRPGNQTLPWDGSKVYQKYSGPNKTEDARKNGVREIFVPSRPLYFVPTDASPLVAMFLSLWRSRNALGTLDRRGH